MISAQQLFSFNPNAFSILFIFLEKNYHSKYKFNYSSNTKIQNLSEVSLVKKVIIHITCLIPFLLRLYNSFILYINNSISIYHKTDF